MYAGTLPLEALKDIISIAGEIASRRLLRKGREKNGTRDAASNRERDKQGHLENWGYELGRSSRSLFHIKKRKTSGLTHGDDFVVTGSKGSLLELKKQLESVSNQSKHHRDRFDKELQSAESQKNAGVFLYQRDLPHVDVLIESLGSRLGTRCKPQ